MNGSHPNLDCQAEHTHHNRCYAASQAVPILGSTIKVPFLSDASYAEDQEDHQC
jgi:hypothetical protein